MSIAKFIPVDYQKVKMLKEALADAATAGGVAAIPNPFGADCFIDLLVLDITTAATGAATVNAGIAADGTTAADDLIDGLDVNAATGVFHSVDDGGTNGVTIVKWGATEYLTVSQASGDVSDLAGNLYARVWLA